MSDAIEPRKDKQILEYPENWDDIVKKYKEREAEQRVEASTEDAINVIKAKESRSQGLRETLQDKSVKFNPEDHEIKQLRETLVEEDKKAKQIFSERLSGFGSKESRGLKGRVTGQSELK